MHHCDAFSSRRELDQGFLVCYGTLAAGQALREIHLGGYSGHQGETGLTRLPECLLRLPRLEHLDLSGNFNLEHLPDDLGLLPAAPTARRTQSELDGRSHAPRVTPDDDDLASPRGLAIRLVMRSNSSL